MRAAIWNGPGSMEIGTAPDAVCPEDGVLLQVLACGVCGTDVRSFYNGDRRIEAPWVLGHEISGEVVEIGRAPRRRSPRAASASATRSTASRRSGAAAAGCAAAAPRTSACNGELMGFDHPGAYADRVAIPNIALKNLFRIPDGLSRRPRHVRRPALGRHLRPQGHRHRPRRRRRGDRRGPVGTAHAALARLQGAGQVLMLERAARRLELARAILGDERVAYVDTEQRGRSAAVMRATDGFGADVVIVACSSDVAQQDAMEMAAPRGRVLFFGGLPKGTTHIQFPSNVLHYKEVQVHGSYASRHRDQVAALDMLAADAGGIRSVVSDIIGLDETPDAFPRIRAGEALKVVVAP